MTRPIEIPCAVERLENGLTVVVAPQGGVPVVTVDVTYDVGSRVEKPGRTGFAHLFEHLMFEGSESLPKGEHFRLVSSAGGTLNGTTSEDRTNYFETLPSEALELGLFLEADRMGGLLLGQQELDGQREAVKEEKRLRVDNQPYGPSFLLSDTLPYEAFGYAHPVIGSMEDLDGASLADAREFHRRYYAPGNALLCVAGDVEPSNAFRRAREAFGSLPPRESPPPFEDEEKYPGVGRRVEVADPHAALPALHVLFKVPPRRDAALFALGHAALLLSGGESGRLWRRLVKDEEVALSFSASVDERRGPSLFRLFGVARPGRSMGDIERIVLEELSRLASEAPSPGEMSRTRRLLETEMVRSTQTTQAIAFLVSEYGLFDGDPALVVEDLERFLAVTAREVREAAERTFRAEEATIIEVLPSPEPAT